MPLHPASSTRLVDVCEFVQGFLEGVGGLRLTTNGLAEMAIGFVEFRGWILGFRFQATFLFHELRNAIHLSLIGSYLVKDYLWWIKALFLPI